MKVIDPITITDAVLTSCNVPETEYPTYDPTKVYAPGERVIDPAIGVHKVFQQVKGVSNTVTISIASPGVISWTGHGFAAGQPCKLTTTGALPTGLTAETTYYVKSLDANTFKLSATPGGADINTSGSQSGIQTLSANDLAKDPVLETTYWTPVGADKRWAMFDDINNTQTTNADSIEVVLNPTGIANGVFLAGLAGDEVHVQVEDATDGVVYDKTVSLIQSNSASSFYNFCFRRIQRKTAVMFLDLPMYANATITITISKPGGTAKCGMCVIGPVIDYGWTEWNAEASVKDYSTTTFDTDGVSSTVERPWAKDMSFPLLVKSDEIETFFDELAAFRGRKVVYIGYADRALTATLGRFTSLKVVIPGRVYSKAALNIEGSV